VSFKSNPVLSDSAEEIRVTERIQFRRKHDFEKDIEKIRESERTGFDLNDT